MVRYRDLNKLKKQKPQEKRCGPVTTTNITVFWICFCFIMELVTLGMNSWFIRKDKEIKFWHGGLWNECQGEIDRTFCSYIRNTPGWLTASQLVLLVALFSMFVNIIYVMVGIARKSLRIKIMTAITLFTTLSMLIGVVIYTVMGFSDIVSPSTTYYIAWVTVVLHLIAVLMCALSLLRVSRLSKKNCVDYGIKI